MSEPIRVLVFGTTGTGKTSLCNELTNQEEKVSNAVLGVTFESHTYEQVEIPESEGKLLIITDTVGLNEARSGTVNPKEAAKALMELLINSKVGYNLLIHVFRIPRITQTEENNYILFVKTISDNKIPTILVATGCENVEPMSNWASENLQIFRAMNLEYKEIICTCLAKGGRFADIYDQLREESRQAVFEAIKKHATVEPVKIYSTAAKLLLVFQKVWNWLVNRFNLADLEFKISKSLIELLVRIGFTEAEAKKLIRENSLSSKDES